jgi:hypothetical protein
MRLAFAPPSGCPRRGATIRQGQLFEIVGVLAFTQPPGELQKALAVDVTHVVGDLLYAGDLEALTHLDGAHEFAASSKDS